jgi:hypothetical protein
MASLDKLQELNIEPPCKYPTTKPLEFSSGAPEEPFSVIPSSHSVLYFENRVPAVGEYETFMLFPLGWCREKTFSNEEMLLLSQPLKKNLVSRVALLIRSSAKSKSELHETKLTPVKVEFMSTGDGISGSHWPDS